MKKLLFFISFFTFPLFGEIIENVEYSLPNAKAWKLAKEQKSDGEIEGKTLLYIPEESTLETTKEFFAVHGMKFPQILLNQEILEDAIQRSYPGKEFELEILSQDDQSVIYKWTVSEEGKPMIFGLTRFFSTPETNVMLHYQTPHSEIFRQNYADQLRTLKQARVIR